MRIQQSFAPDPSIDAFFRQWRFGDWTAILLKRMGLRQNLNRRCFLWSGTAIGAGLASAASAPTETIYRFETDVCQVRMTVEFFDHYRSNGFWFDERFQNKRFCLSKNGTEGDDCLKNFYGSLAIARYQVRPLNRSPSLLAIREHVRTIDHDVRLSMRPPFERTIALDRGIASDIQAFGYQSSAGSSTETASDPWCLLRQDLYLDRDEAPFLVVHWKHSLSAIRLLDIIPGDRTRPVRSSRG